MDPQSSLLYAFPKRKQQVRSVSFLQSWALVTELGHVSHLPCWTLCCTWAHSAVIRPEVCLLLSPLLSPLLSWQISMSLSYAPPFSSLCFIVHQTYFISYLIQYDFPGVEAVMSALIHEYSVSGTWVDKPEPKQSCMVTGVTKAEEEFWSFYHISNVCRF